MINAAPLDLAIGNVMRRVLFIVREEYGEHQAQLKASASAMPPAFRRGGSVMLVPNLSDSMYIDVADVQQEEFQCVLGGGL